MMKKAPDKVREYVKAQGLLDNGDSVLVGLSGGADSVGLLFVLLMLSKEYELRLKAVHVHHGIRGKEADRDAEFCRALCERLGVELETRRIDVPALSKETGMGLEETGRTKRYEIFEEISTREDFSRIAVAHHKNDVAETVLFQMIRGSRLKGLSGIRPSNGKIIRPMLCLTKEEIVEFLSQINETFIFDSTNAEDDCSRNIIRNKVIPELTQIKQNAVLRIAETAEYLGRVTDYFDNIVADAFDRCSVVIYSGEVKSVRLNLQQLLKEDRLIAEMIVYKAICMCAGRKKDITSNYVETTLSLAEKQAGSSIDLKYGLTAIRDSANITISRKDVFDNSYLNCNNNLLCERISVNGDSAFFISENVNFQQNGLIKYFDYDKLTLAFSGYERVEPVLRFATKEDKMVVFEDGRGKVVFDILKDAKVPATARGRVQTVAIGDEALLLCGFRSSENYRIDEKTKEVIKIAVLEE